jgi:hypothetical protein
MSRSKDLHAAISCGVPVGVVVGELRFLQKMVTIPDYLAAGGAVFVDSGAFTSFKSGAELNFRKILDDYTLIADSAALLGASLKNLYLVAPDCVGDQVRTLALLGEHRAVIRSFIEEGCSLIVPLQCGAIPASEMLSQVKDILGTDKFVAGVPSNAAAMSVQECSTLEHHSFHILGRVQMNDQQQQRIAALQQRSKDVVITADANWLRSRLKEVCGTSDRFRIAAAGAEQGLNENSHRARAIREVILTDDRWVMGKA